MIPVMNIFCVSHENAMNQIDLYEGHLENMVTSIQLCCISDSYHHSTIFPDESFYTKEITNCKIFHVDSV